MRRAELSDAAKSVTEALDTSNLTEALDAIVKLRGERGGPEVYPSLLNGLKVYAIKAHQFDDAAKELAEILGLTALEDPSLWTELMAGDSSIRLAYQLNEKIKFAIVSLPRLTKLIQPEALRLAERIQKGESSEYADKALLSVIVFEQTKRFSSPLRLISVLESVSLFYETCALMNGDSPEELSVLTCDSGSDKSFDFLGAAKIIECVKELVLSLWDRVVFYREHQLDERLDLVAKALPIIAQIKMLEEEKKLEPEQAEIYRRNIFEASNKFIQAGATIPEVKGLHHDVRLLMTPTQKLLTGGTDDGPEKSQSEPNQPFGELNKAGVDLSKLNAEDKEKLEQILKKSQDN